MFQLSFNGIGIEPIPTDRKTALKMLDHCRWCGRRNVEAYQSETVCVSCKNGKERLKMACFPEIDRWRASFSREEKRYIRPWQIRAIWEAANYSCLNCERQFHYHQLTNLHLDHVMPKSAGGATNIRNLQPLCNSCNSIKQASTYWQRWDCRDDDWEQRLVAAINCMETWPIAGMTFKELLEAMIQ